MSDEELLVEARKFEKNLLNFFWRQGVQYSEGEDLVQEIGRASCRERVSVAV